MFTKRFVTDTRSGIEYESIRDAWEACSPEIHYNTFLYRLQHGRISYLHVGPKRISKPRTEGFARVAVIDPDTGDRWTSVSACAADLGVSRQAVQNAVKRKRSCRGHRLTTP